ncbi:HTH domain protein [Natronomonas moolapensis 8.8.11]|uniref:HTH domain protein n=1 Tax=Natronomonas moolapensis (strain DSM 18674 / CECT 7526 / JCM 14361 / 8.8.11) TaxID=268739 RepID=M1Y3L4_NATM8|nr:HTH domain protein [Natronomonas moolapensis 8.8.11]
MSTEAVELLGRKYSVDILRATKEPRSVSWLSQALDIPVATCYRRVEELSDNMYLREVAADESTNRTQYCRTTDSIEVDFASDLLVSGSRSEDTRELPRDTIPLDSVTFDEFSRTVAIVEDYFGDLIDDVAVHAPVSRRQLVAVLARAQLSGARLADDGLADNGDIVYQSNGETFFWLDGDFWANLGGDHYLRPDEGRAAREVHRRLVEAIGGVADCNRERDPFILINGTPER